MEPTDPSGEDRVIDLTEADAADGLSLSTAAGWNQTIDDWHLLLRLGRGYGIRTVMGELVASGIALPHSPGIGWIGMLLVRADFRRQGFASRILMRAVSQLRSMGLVPMLDATPAGQPVYARMGFTEISGLARWRRTGGGLAEHAAASDDLQSVLVLDREAFGADRSQLLRAFAARAGSAVVIDRHQSGYALCRQGRTATHIGPIVTLDPARQCGLFNAVAARVSGTAVIDIPDAAESMRQAAIAAGFGIERPLTRMALGRDHAFGMPGMIAAIAGPEFG